MNKIFLIFLILFSFQIYAQKNVPKKNTKTEVKNSNTKDSKNSDKVKSTDESKDTISKPDESSSKGTKDTVKDASPNEGKNSSENEINTKTISDSKEESSKTVKSENLDPNFKNNTDNSEFARNPENKSSKKNPKVAALLGIVPGVGQAYIGNYYTAAFQMGLFLGLRDIRGQYLNQPDYIKQEDRLVKFNFEEVVISEEIKKQNPNFVYSDIPYKAAFSNNEIYKNFENGPIFSETKFDRDSRLIRERKLGEENLLYKYGTYSRESRSSHRADALGNPILSTMMYSVYSSFRDAGGLGEEKKSETIGQLAYSPFNFDYLKRPLVFTPILLIAAIAGLGSANGNPILVPPSLKRDGSLYATAFINGLSPGVGEEAFFRGYLNYSLIQSYGAGGGIGGSSLLFMLAHEGNADARDGRLSRLLAGVYLGYIHYKSNFDIKPGIAVHFWWNFIIGVSMLSQYKGDSGYDKSPREVYYMPIQYSFTF